MPITLQCETPFVVTLGEVNRLWTETLVVTGHADAEVTVRCVDEQESRRLNLEYRKKDAPTNVLTFSYPNDPEGAEHDIALCLSVAAAEAEQREVALRDYVALVLVHAFLHATGMDHERSSEDAAAQQAAETTILTNAGYSALAL